MRFVPGCNACCKSTVTVTFEGCCSVALSGVAYTIKDPSGATIASGTTSSSGQVTFTATATGTYTVTASKTRFATATNAALGTLSTPCPATVGWTFTLSPDTGYACSCCCPDPFKTTLQLTDSVFGGPVTLTWNSGLGAWVGSQTVSWGGSGSPSFCPAQNVTITYSLSAATCQIIATCPTDTSGCPNNSNTGPPVGLTFPPAGFPGTTVTCSPVDISSSKTTSAFPWAPTGGSATVTITITE